ncbi:MAG: ATP-binding cassette domain-containing protein [Pseudomonadota bacterium]|nr:ATP-binding cassette domain-containing protein [Pseudomonadota bacterium]
MGQIVDILTNIMSVHLFAAKSIETQKLKIHIDDYVVADQRRDWCFLTISAIQGLSFVVYQAISFVLLIRGFKEGVITAGDFALLLTINVPIVQCLWSLSGKMLEFSNLWGNIMQGLTVALAPLEIQDKSDAKQLIVTKGQIIFDTVGFHYKGSEPLFANKSITIEPGQKVGLVGYSGGGKTTFCNLILRLYDVTDGRILIDEHDIRDVTQDSLRANIGMIPQDPSLFHRTLMDNIRYGKSDATDAEVITAAKSAHAHDFILKLPNDYDSLVGERGVKLSGGQRQSVAIARAMLKNAPILILDEATSQLDSVTERDIQDSLWNLIQGKTAIVIAHRLSTLLHMDRILVFDGGKIVEDGTHDELLVRDGLYKTLWNAQVGGFLPEVRGHVGQ